MTNAQLSELVCIYASNFIGKPYIFGGDDPILGFDCSGLILELLASIGCTPKEDLTAQGIYEHYKLFNCRPQGGTLDQGDLVFFGKSLTEITHVAMMLNNVQMLEAGGGGRKTVDAIQAAKDNAFIRIRPLINRKDFVASLTVDYTRYGVDKHIK